jgi:tetratricopeptide (TPR) repeat protein
MNAKKGKFMKFLVVFVLLITNFLLFSQSNAKQVDALQNYQQLLSQGHKLYQNPNYQLALNAYQQSFALKPLDSTLNNIAICHFKLQQWPQALAKFEELNNNQQGVALLEYYIAVIHKKLGNTEQAINGFYDLQYADDDSIALLAAQQLEQISPLTRASTIDAVKIDKSLWRHMIDTQLGYDSNVTLPFDDAETLSIEKSDRYFNFLANTSWLSSSDLSKAWLFDLTYFSSNYQEASDYDVSLLSLNGRKYFTPDAWQGYKFYLGLSYDSINLAGNDYLKNRSLISGASYKLSASHKVLLEVVLKNVSEGSSDYAYLAGSANRIKLSWHQKVDYGYLNAGMIFQQDDFNDKYTYIVTESRRRTRSEVDNFTSYSTNRVSFFASRFWHYGKWEFRTNAKYRISEYDDENIVSGETVGLREDKHIFVMLGGEYNVNDNIAITTEIDWSKNSSNFDVYDYDQYTITLGAAWVF